MSPPFKEEQVKKIYLHLYIVAETVVCHSVNPYTKGHKDGGSIFYFFKTKQLRSVYDCKVAGAKVNANGEQKFV